MKVWPHAGRALGLGRGAAYAAAARKEIDVIRIGRSVSAASAGVMASNAGTARTAQVPRRKVRRGMDFLVITIANPPHLEWGAVDDTENDG